MNATLGQRRSRLMLGSWSSSLRLLLGLAEMNSGPDSDGPHEDLRVGGAPVRGRSDLRPSAHPDAPAQVGGVVRSGAGVLKALVASCRGTTPGCCGPARHSAGRSS